MYIIGHMTCQYFGANPPPLPAPQTHNSKKKNSFNNPILSQENSVGDLVKRLTGSTASLGVIYLDQKAIFELS